MNQLYYQRLQILMTILGYYNGACDGVWGPKCIEAKLKWEDDESFEPAVPNNGMPFAPGVKLPDCMDWVRGPEKFRSLKLTKKAIDEILAKEQHTLLTSEHIDKRVAKSKPVAKPADDDVEEMVSQPQPEPEQPVAETKFNQQKALDPLEGEAPKTEPLSSVKPKSADWTKRPRKK